MLRHSIAGWICGLIGLCLVAGSSANLRADDPVLKELLEVGVQVIPGQRVRLPAPTLSGTAGLDEQRRVILLAAGQHPVDEFTRKSAVTPFNLKMESLTDAQGKRYAQTVDVWFIAYGRLETLRDRQLLEELASAASQESGSVVAARTDLLTIAQLQKYGIELQESEQEREVLATFATPLLDRVLVSGVVHSWQTFGTGEITVSGILDSRVDKEPELSNRWQAIEDRAGEDPKLGPPSEYSGFGGYLRATALQEPAGALLIEAHVVFHEPEGWFRGANLLRSKLPLALQDQVRSFRKKLAK
jgi:hypothetical protein